MARKRIIYQSEALFVAPTGATDTGDYNHVRKSDGQTVKQAGITQLHRIQDISHTVDINRTDINEFGQLSYIAREVIEPPTVGLDFSYYAVGGYNESGLGLSMYGPGANPHPDWPQVTSGFQIGEKADTDKNFYVLTVPEGMDATNADHGRSIDWSETAADKNAVIGFGNAFLSSYTFDAAVGDIPSVSCSVEAQNILYTNDSTGIQNPSVGPEAGLLQAGQVTLPTANSGRLGVAALRPGDVILDLDETVGLPGGGVHLNQTTGILVQNFSFELPLARTPIEKLGAFGAVYRPLDAPQSATLTVNAIIAGSTNKGPYQSGSLTDILCQEGADTRDITLTMYEKCGRAEADKSIEIRLKKAYLDSQNMSASIGDNKTVDLTFSCQLGGGNETGAGIFMSGKDVGRRDNYGGTP